jgi:hypothetical protein
LYDGKRRRVWGDHVSRMFIAAKLQALAWSVDPSTIANEDIFHCSELLRIQSVAHNLRVRDKKPGCRQRCSDMDTGYGSET